MPARLADGYKRWKVSRAVRFLKGSNISEDDKSIASIILKIAGGLILGTFILSFRATRILALITAPVIAFLYFKKRKAANILESVEELEDEPATPVFYVETVPAPIRRRSAIFEVVGESYRKDSFLYVGRPNPDWRLTDSELLKRYGIDDCIYQYLFDGLTCQIIRERTNPADINALRVDIDGTPVGYIARTDHERIEPFLCRDSVSWFADISWGPVKLIRRRGGHSFVHEEDLHFSVVLTAHSG